MGKSLVIVESPAKAKTIEKFLGRRYHVRASMGHVRDLPKSQFGVDLEHNFTPKYINIRGKGELIRQLKAAAKEADRVLLATDPDREGEAIAWHLTHILNIDQQEPCRITFNEITKDAIQRAVKSPRPIDRNMVDAQQARRILDRIVGYMLSPLLWRKVRKGLSAGRVQSVAVRLICDREREIQAFTPEEYWTITARLREKAKSPLFDAELVSINGEKPVLANQEQALAIQARLQDAVFTVAEIKQRERRRMPYPPFNTSSLQQEAARKLGFSPRKTMMVAQQLYEGLEVGEHGPVGLITYMRTDSRRIAASAQAEARQYIIEHYGQDYVPSKPPVYASKNAQDAHEAIRPTHVDFTPAAVAPFLNRDQERLYKLIWERFIASQMSPAVYDTMTVDIKAADCVLRANGARLKFPGFLAVYEEKPEEGEEEESATAMLPALAVGQVLKLHKILPKQHFTQPPPRYTEASLVKTLEEKGIGRPSTYAPIIQTIIERGYVTLQEKKFYPTELGFIVTDLLKEYFSDIFNVAFTAHLENKLDEIAENREKWTAVLQEFYHTFQEKLQHAEQAIDKIALKPEVSDVVCENCGRPMVIKQGRYGKFLACPGFPECRNTKPLLQEVGVPCPRCGGEIVQRHTKRGRVFYGCKNYPLCNFVTWDTPLPQKCPTCGAFLVKHSFRGQRFVVRCSNEACPTRQQTKVGIDSQKNKAGTQEKGNEAS